MTAADSIYIPFPLTVQHPKLTSTLHLIVPYEKHITGCNNAKCPCRIWPQCSYYNKMKWGKSRKKEDEHMKTIWEYYNNIFRITYDMPIANMNG